MLSSIPHCNGIIEILLLFYAYSFGSHHVAAGVHSFIVGHRDYDKEHSCWKHSLMLLHRAPSVYDAGVDACADVVERIVGRQRGWFSEEAGGRAHLCGREDYCCQSFLAVSVRATLYWCIQCLPKSGVRAGIAFWGILTQCRAVRLLCVSGP